MSDPTRLSRRYSTMVVATISLIVLTCAAYLIPTPYVTMRPGPAFDTLGSFDDQPMFTFGKDVKTYPTTGSLDFTTVSVTRADTHLSLADTVRAYFDRDVAERIAGECDVVALAGVHRVGDLQIGDLAVVVAASAAHRADAFEACRRLIDELKTDVPVWKHQTFASGDVEWVHPQ